MLFADTNKVLAASIVDERSCVMMSTTPSQQVDLLENVRTTSTIAAPLHRRDANELGASVVRVAVRKSGPTDRASRDIVKQRNTLPAHVATETNPEEALAVGVLSQAAHDLRRYHSAKSGIKRELYLDAYTWIAADDLSWPYSFVNVCELLHTSAETMRAELLADSSLGWLHYWMRTGGRISISLYGPVSRFFREMNSTNEPKTDAQIRGGLTHAIVH